MGVGFCPQLGGVGPCPAQCIWQGSGFAADQTNAMLAVAVGGTSCISLVSVAAADENSLTPLHRLLPTETASLGFGGSPVGGGDKRSRFAFFSVPAWGWYHYPRRAIHAVETLDAQGTRWLNKLLVVYSLPVGSASAHSGSRGETRGVLTARDIGRVDRVKSLGTLCIVTFGTAQLDGPLAVAAAHHGGNADFA